MKHRLFASAYLTLLALPVTPALAAAETYVMDPGHTNIVWQAEHFGFSEVYGKFSKVEGSITLDEEHPENSKVNVTVAIDGLMTGMVKFDAHLKSKDFFDVEHYADAKFESTKVVVTAPGKTATVTGNLTLHGVTKPVVLNVTFNKMGEHPMTKKKTVGFSATATIKRSDFGMGYGVPNVSDDIPLLISTEASVQ